MDGCKLVLENQELWHLVVSFDVHAVRNNIKWSYVKKERGINLEVSLKHFYQQN